MNKSISPNFSIGLIVVFFLFALLSLFISSCVSTTTHNELVSDSGYTITSFNTDIIVNENNSLDIQETIVCDFDISSHGITRAISNKQIVHKKIGEQIVSRSYAIDVTNIKSSNTNIASIETENDCTTIYLGEENEYVNGIVTYNISYTVNLGDDRFKDFDMFYYNVIGNQWTTTIEQCLVNVTFPKEVTNPLYIYIGENEFMVEPNQPYSQGNLTVDYTDTTLMLEYNAELLAFNGITCLIDLPSNYFVLPFNISYIIGIILLIVILGLIIWLYKARSNKNKPVEVVNFSVPKNINSAEVGYIIDSYVDKKDISSLIVYWAQKGYITILDENDNVTLTKVKEADNGMKDYEKTLFDKIFEDNTTINLSALGDLSDEALVVQSGIIKDNKEKIFNKKSTSSRFFLLMLSILALIVGGVCALLPQAGETDWFFFGANLVLMAILFAFVPIALNRRDSQSQFVKKFIFVGLTIVIGLFLLSYLLLMFDMSSDPYLLRFISCAIAIYAIYLVFKFNTKTNEGNNLVGEILGLKKFIQLAEKSRLEMLVKENPSAFYEALPFAYVLGVSDVWIKKFANITLESPEWLTSTNQTDIFDIFIFSSIMRNMNSITDSFNPTPINNDSGTLFGGGGFSGGGFSGGGFGGGGGGRW